MMSRKMNLVLLSVATLFVIYGCNKEPGPGGQASIVGYVHAKEIDASGNYFQVNYPAQKYDIYIQYGDDSNYSDRVETNFNGNFQFEFLRTGSYTITVFEYDPQLGCPNCESYQQFAVDISDKKEVFDMGTINVNVKQ